MNSMPARRHAYSGTAFLRRLIANDAAIAPVNRLLELTCIEQVLVWATRCWVCHYKVGKSPHPTISALFKLAGAEPASCMLNRLLATFAAYTRAPIDIRCPTCLWLSTDERRLLAAIAAAQRSALEPVAAREDVDSIVAAMLVPKAHGAGKVVIEALAYELGRAALVVPNRRYRFDASTEASEGARECPRAHGR